MVLFLNGKMRHRDVQMMDKKSRDIVNDKVGFRSRSLSTPVPISIAYDSVCLNAKYRENKKLHEDV